jgi:hypothetical protein
MIAAPIIVDGFNFIEFRKGGRFTRVAEFEKIAVVYDIADDELIKLVREYYLDRGKILKVSCNQN